VGARLDEPIAPQRAHHARDIAGVEAQPRPQVARRGARRLDLEQHPILPERPAAEVAVADHPGLPRDQPVEATHASDL
jgi:hypothetical protein